MTASVMRALAVTREVRQESIRRFSRISVTFSATFLVLATCSVRGDGGAAELSAEPISARTCNWNSTKPYSARRSKSACDAMKLAMRAAVRVLRRVKLRWLAGRAMDAGRCDISRDFSALLEPVQPARVGAA